MPTITFNATRILLLLAVTLLSGCRDSNDSSTVDSETTESVMERPTAEALGAAVVKAIAARDLEAYQSCWISTRQMVGLMAKLGVEEGTEADLARKNTDRDKSIAESNNKIQELIDDRKVDRSSLQLAECTIHDIEERKAPKGSVRAGNRVTITIRAGEADWQFEIDDALFYEGNWYFVDSPINLFAGDTTLHFDDHRRS